MDQCELVLVEQGVEIPSRVFVGRVPFNMTDSEFMSFFKKFGKVRDARIVSDRLGVSKGFGFVTFETEEEAQYVLQKGKLKYKSTYMNICKAIRKQQGGQFESSSKEFVDGQRQVSLLHHYTGDYLLHDHGGMWYAEPLSNNCYMQPIKPSYPTTPSPQMMYYPQQTNQWYPSQLNSQPASYISTFNQISPSLLPGGQTAGSPPMAIPTPIVYYSPIC